MAVTETKENHKTFKFQNKLLVMNRNLRNSAEWARRGRHVFLKHYEFINMDTSPYSDQYKYEYWDHPALQIITFYKSAFDMHCLPPTMFVRQLWYQYTSTTQKKYTKPNSLHVSCAASYILYLLRRAYTHMANDIHIPFGRPGWAENTNMCFKRCSSQAC